MNTIILIILTLVFLALSILGLIFFRWGFSIGSMIGVIMFFIGIIGIYIIGMSLISEDIYIKETVCSYTVGKSDEICANTYSINFNFTFPSISDKIGLTYLITTFILMLLMLREFLLIVWNFDGCMNHDF